MKNYLCLFILAALGACQEENEVIYSVDPALAQYVETFYSEAAERGVTIPKNLVAEFSPVQAIVRTETTQDQNYLYVDQHLFDGFNAAQREAYITYALAGLFLHVSRPCIDEAYNNPPRPCLMGINNYEREAAFNSLF